MQDILRNIIQARIARQIKKYMLPVIMPALWNKLNTGYTITGNVYQQFQELF